MNRSSEAPVLASAELLQVKRIVDEQYKRGMKLLTDNMYLLDELAKTLMEQEKVGGEELVKMINKAAAEGRVFDWLKNTETMAPKMSKGNQQKVVAEKKTNGPSPTLPRETKTSFFEQ